MVGSLRVLLKRVASEGLHATDVRVAPCRLVFVLKETNPERWVSNGSTDFAVQLKAPDFSDVARKALEAEGSSSHWSLFDRFCLAIELLDAADSAGGKIALTPTWDSKQDETLPVFGIN